ncbi:hypothetical protein [Nocardioides sp. TF02-7]|uniref:hypothetical protein n=1 Tax=Nocardioides sp. TF02-7 TaxID=2917724 RepID=UPI001F067CBF|nr:hypothetical protein [Nocardioides sp. TF02-7]UMG93723.1 hypothetical protein MF408_05980 [Nocardioides sp. TF02-7]
MQILRTVVALLAVAALALGLGSPATAEPAPARADLASLTSPARPAPPLVVDDPRGDAEGDQRRGRRAADLLWTRYAVVDRTLRVTWRVVDMTVPLTPILEVEGRVGGRSFTVDVSRVGRGPTGVELWIGADERRCRGLGGFSDRRRDVGGFWLPLRCLPAGRTARLQTFVILEADLFASDSGRAVRRRIR